MFNPRIFRNYAPEREEPSITFLDINSAAIPNREYHTIIRDFIEHFRPPTIADLAWRMYQYREHYPVVRALLDAHPPPPPQSLPTLTPFLDTYEAQIITVLTPSRMFAYHDGQQVITAILAGITRNQIKSDTKAGRIKLSHPPKE